jgi:hypothetical protein
MRILIVLQKKIKFGANQNMSKFLNSPKVHTVLMVLVIENKLIFCLVSFKLLENSKEPKF